MPAQTSTARPTAGRELTLLALLYLAYSAARLVADPDLTTATANAHSLLRLEGDLFLDVERPVNAVLAALPALALASSYWYSLLHYVVTPAVLFWVYRSHPDRYRLARNALVLGSALGIVGFALLPVAPPRMLPGYVDTLAATSEHGWWGADASAPRGLGSLTNELAAMPSLHVGWALWCAAVVLLCASRRWVRVLAVAYPVATTVVVVATANHYLLDAVAGAVVIGAGALLARAPLRLPLPQGLLPLPWLRPWTGGLPDLLRVQRQHLPVTDGRGGDAPAGRRPRAHGPGGGRLGGHRGLARR